MAVDTKQNASPNSITMIESTLRISQSKYLRSRVKGYEVDERKH